MRPNLIMFILWNCHDQQCIYIFDVQLAFCDGSSCKHGRKFALDLKSMDYTLIITLLLKEELHLSSSVTYLRMWFVTGILTWEESLVEQEMHSLPEHLSSHQTFSGVRVVQSLVPFVVFCRPCFAIFILFSFWRINQYLYRKFVHINVLVDDIN